MQIKGGYSIGGETFATKSAIEARCRQIRDATLDGTLVSGTAELAFLLDLFSAWHDEWDEKTGGGFVGFTTMTVYAHTAPTRCFAVRTADGDHIDVSFPHAVRRITTARSPSLIPQALRDFRNAARVAIAPETMAFRKMALATNAVCPLTGIQLTAGICAVDHYRPTFDELLFNFCQQHGINPLVVQVGSLGGVRAEISDVALSSSWQAFHQQHAQLRVVEKVANLKIPKARVAWDTLAK